MNPGLMQGQNLTPKPGMSAMPNAPTFNSMLNPGLMTGQNLGPTIGGEGGMGHPGMDDGGMMGGDTSREEIMENLRDRMRGMPFNRMPRPY